MNFRNFKRKLKRLLLRKFNSFSININERGIPVSHYDMYINLLDLIRGNKIGKQKSIVAVSEKGLDYWTQFKKEDEVFISYDWKKYSSQIRKNHSKDFFLNCVEWIYNNATFYENDQNYVLWHYEYPFYYNTKTGWVSSHAQGQCIQLLIKSYKFTGNDKYKKMAELARNSFYVPLSENGFTDKNVEKGWWYNKFASNECDDPKVLNGMIFALFGLYSYYKEFKDNKSSELINKGICSVKNSLHLYDSGDWSYYDRLGKKAGKHYHNIHIKQLNKLFELTGDSIFKDYSEKFESYKTSKL